jgi:hypothetical protein
MWQFRLTWHTERSRQESICTKSKQARNGKDKQRTANCSGD